MRIRQMLAAHTEAIRPALTRRRIVIGVPAGVAAGVLALVLLRAAAGPGLLPTAPYTASPPTAVSGPTAPFQSVAPLPDPPAPSLATAPPVVPPLACK